jgi:hypothetical protein
VRPGKLFTANRSLIVSQIGTLTAEAFDSVLDAVVELIKPSSP